MTQPNLEGLRMAFADGSPIRSGNGAAAVASWSVRTVAKEDVTDWNIWPDNALERIILSQLKIAGRVQPLEMPLHPRLNVLVGGRGSGKSSFVHALRLATQRARDLPRYADDSPVSESPAGDFWRWAQVPTAQGGDGVILRGAVATSEITVLYRAPAQSAELRWNASTPWQGIHSLAPVVRIGELGTPPTRDGGAYAPSRFPISIYSQKQVLR